MYVYVAMWCKGLKLRSAARLHSTLYLETQYSVATKGMQWISNATSPPRTQLRRTAAYYPAVVQPLLQ
jgi:hypothetical protein